MVKRYIHGILDLTCLCLYLDVSKDNMLYKVRWSVLPQAKGKTIRILFKYNHLCFSFSSASLLGNLFLCWKCSFLRKKLWFYVQTNSLILRWGAHSFDQQKENGYQFYDRLSLNISYWFHLSILSCSIYRFIYYFFGTLDLEAWLLRKRWMTTE